MAKTQRLSLDSIASLDNVQWAMHKACRGKRHQVDVRALLQSPNNALWHIRAALMDGRMPMGKFDSFTIRDPKKRVIHAAALVDRIAHHALIRFAGPRLDRALLPSVYACRIGKGVHAAVAYAQHQSRRFAWVMHTDITQYFASIDHQILQQQLLRRFRGDGCRLLNAVIDSHGAETGTGLPIGALTSQHFANHYLSEMDRWCLAQSGVGAHCRYMDDQLLWAEDKHSLCRLQAELAERLSANLGLVMKPALIQRTAIGVAFCGIKIKPFQLKASQRRRRRYRMGVERYEMQWMRGEIDSLALQRGYDAVHGILLPADEQAFRRRFLTHRVPLDA